MICEDANSNLSKSYSTKFCLATKIDFRYYKSKEQFLTLQKPLMIIPFSLIVEANLIKNRPESKKYENFFIRVDNTNKIFDIQSSRIDLSKNF